MKDHGYVYENYRALAEEVHALTEKSGRSITLVSVTKSGSDSELLALADAGVTDIGENRPGELKRRALLLSEAGYTPRLHQIGNLQRNKVKLIIESVSLIHSLDTLELAREIGKQAVRCGRTVPVLIEINSASEPQKDGVMPNEAESFYLAVSEIPGIEIAGVMTMGPVCNDPEDIRPYFRLTKEIFDNLKEKYGFVGEGVLSMGMSDSYKVAIEEGATLIRVGRRLFLK